MRAGRPNRALAYCRHWHAPPKRDLTIVVLTTSFVCVFSVRLPVHQDAQTRRPRSFTRPLALLLPTLGQRRDRIAGRHALLPALRRVRVDRHGLGHAGRGPSQPRRLALALRRRARARPSSAAMYVSGSFAEHAHGCACAKPRRRRCISRSSCARLTLPATASFKAAVLQAHNSNRRRHGARNLVWSDSLARSAAKWAGRCIFEHGGTNGAGQNTCCCPLSLADAAQTSPRVRARDST